MSHMPSPLKSASGGDQAQWEDHLHLKSDKLIGPSATENCLQFPYLAVFNPNSTFLLVRRIKVSFADYSSLARSTCVGKEGIIGTDLRGTAFSGCWTSFPSFKIWPCIYWALSTSPGLWPSAANSRSHNFMEDTRVIIFLKVAILC